MKITKRAKRKLAADAARGLREGFSIAAAESDGRLAFARGEIRETAGPTEPESATSPPRSSPGPRAARPRHQSRAARRGAPGEKLEKFKERIAGL